MKQIICYIKNRAKKSHKSGRKGSFFMLTAEQIRVVKHAVDNAEYECCGCGEWIKEIDTVEYKVFIFPGFFKLERFCAHCAKKLESKKEYIGFRYVFHLG